MDENPYRSPKEMDGEPEPLVKAESAAYRLPVLMGVLTVLALIVYLVWLFA